MTCEIVYNPPASAPDHVRKLVTVKGVDFVAGKAVVVADDVAFAATAGQPDGWWRVLKGTPKAAPAKTGATVKAAAVGLIPAAEAATLNGESALKGVARLSAKTSAILMKGAEAIEKAMGDGAMDDEIGLVAVWLWMSGDSDMEALARAAAIRCAKLDAKAKTQAQA